MRACINNIQQQVQPIDCRKGLPKLDDNSITAVITDPPYFIAGMGDDWNDAKLKKTINKSNLVGGLPVGMKFDKKQSQALQAFMAPIALEWMRVVKPGGFILCFMQPRLTHSAAMAMENAGIEIRDLLVWKRPGQAKAFKQEHFVNHKKDLSDKAKQAIIANLGGRKTPQLRPENESIILGQVPKEGTFVENWLRWQVGLIDVDNPFIAVDSFPSTIMEVQKPRERHAHLTPKPVPLLRHLIRIFGGKTPCILDPFAGCGSTGEACVKENCNFIGFEIEPAYATMANSRIKKCLQKKQI